MFSFRNTARTLSVAGAIATLAACSQSSSSTPPVPTPSQALESAQTRGGGPQLTLANFHGAVAPFVAALEQSGRVAKDPSLHSWLDRDAIARGVDLTSFDPSAKSLVYAAAYGKKLIDIYQPGLAANDSNPAMVGQIVLPHTPSGLAVDRNQNLYAVVYLEGIEVFSKDDVTSPIRILTDNYAAQGLSVGPDGTVYAGNQEADASGNVGISVFPPGATTASKTLDDPSIQFVFSTTVDSQNNVYLTYDDKDTSKSAFAVFRKGSSTMTKLPLSNETYVAELDPKGGIIGGDPDTAAIDTYPNGSSTRSATFPTEAQGDFFFFDQTIGRNRIYTQPLNSPNGLTGGPINEFSYPAGVQLDSIEHGYPYGFGIVTAPKPAYAPPYNAPTPIPTPKPSGAPSTSPSSTPTQGACTNGASGPKLSPQSDTLYYSAAVQCVGPGVPYSISATATLYNGKTNSVISSFTGGELAANYYKQESIPCPGVGSYYTIVTSNVAPPVRSVTETGSGC